MKPLSKANRLISAQIRKIMQSQIPSYRLYAILDSVTAKDTKFTQWLGENGFETVLRASGKTSTWSKQDFTRFPWFDEDGKLMIKKTTLDEIEREIKSEQSTSKTLQ